MSRGNDKYKSRRFDIYGTDKIDSNVLETFDYEYVGKPIEIVISTNEFTSVCPWSGLPDFAELTIKYIPDKKCIELKSLKYYLHSYRNVGIFYEHVVNRILDDLVKACEPLKMEVIAKFTIRGGLQTTVKSEYSK
ncbi:MAG: preQ(1) synthase [Spirochaetia bacterium]|nr:preQ(1) synthase [Spirochaetota bacterium]MCX8096309.1 preQ(1) synthase [Spirochaetota bacterium]MDW8112330.1 preQ(1) synthase [Spirochaetia bacterium]